MHHSLFVVCYTYEKDLSSVKVLVNSLKEWIRKSQLHCHSATRVDDMLISFCQVDDKFEYVENREQETWKAVDCVDEDSIQHTKTGCSENDSTGTGQMKLADYLLHLADNLPYAGFTLDLFLVNPSFSEESYAHTLGALLCLSEWHSAEITIVAKPEDQQDGMVLMFISLLRAKQWNLHHIPSVQKPVWRGFFVWPGDKGFLEGGLSLECRDLERLKQKLLTLHFWKTREKDGASLKTDRHLVFGRHLELLACVKLASVPLYLMDDFSLHLHVNPETYLGQLASTMNEKDGLLLRIPLYVKRDMPVASGCGLPTSVWKDDITTNGQSTPEPAREPLPCRQHLFLLVAGGQAVTDPLTVSVLHSPSEVAAEVFEEVTYASLFGLLKCKTTETYSNILTSVAKTLQSLMLTTSTQFCHVDHMLLTSLVHHINHVKKTATVEGNEFELTTRAIVGFVREAQEALLQQGVKQRPWQNTKRSPVTQHQFVYLQGLQGSPSGWPERKALQDSESRAKVLRRYQSNESCSLMLSSPLAPEDSSMEAKDMVKWFRPDGNAIQEDLSPVKPAVQPLRLSSHEEKNLQWPACKDLQYHDVYYEHIKKCERQEKFYQKFRDNIMLEEGHHVCAEKPHVPALRYRSSQRRNQMDFTCGGSKLTPITHTVSPSSMLAATPSAKKRWANENSGSKRRPSRRRLAEDDGPFSAPTAKVKKDGSHSRGDNPEKKGHLITSLRSGKSFGEENSDPQESSSVFYPKKSNASLPPFRRLSQPDVVSIFTPPMPKNMTFPQTSDKDHSVPESVGLGKQTDQIPGWVTAADTEHQPSEESTDPSVSSGSQAESQRESRSQRHNRRLEKIVSDVLVAAGVPTTDTLYNSCFPKLFQVTKFYVKQLPDAYNLKAEMKNIAEKQVEQVVDLERRRLDLAVKKKLRKSSLVSKRQNKSSFM